MNMDLAYFNHYQRLSIHSYLYVFVKWNFNVCKEAVHMILFSVEDYQRILRYR